MDTFFHVVIFSAGFAACWFTKDAIVRLVTGTEGLVRSLEAKLTLLKARL